MVQISDTKSSILFEKSKKLIPGGVNSPVRAFQGVGSEPIFFRAGKGAHLIDVDGNRYIDYVGSWGALILGHCDEEVVAAVEKTLRSGTSFGAPTELEYQLAAKIQSAMPSIEKIRMVNSGTEATMTALRLARGFTGKNKIIKFKGCYHGHSDSLLVKAGSGLLTLGLPSSPGIPASIAEHTLIADYNDLEQTKRLFDAYEGDIAAVIVEPVAGNMGFVKPLPDFLLGLKRLCDTNQALLIFDEVMTGFRVALGGAQAIYEVIPDLTTLGKVIGGGLPVGALGGRKEIMDYLAPEGPIYQAGTLSGNPLTMAAGLATLKKLEEPNFYETLNNKASRLLQGFDEQARACGLPFCHAALGGMFGFCFSDKKAVINDRDVAESNEMLFKQFYHGMLQRGVYFAPSLYEAGFISSTHTEDLVLQTLEASKQTFATMVGI
ncbi:MAG: glutamate-1-semialdehyde 2,1-aminomutase [Legionella sp.]|nr:glutamate-1-semialdehyde 2,1-aminomutase [Legionella sp.]